MAEAFQSSLRYLCFIQIAQLLQLGKVPKHPFINDFLDAKEDDYTAFDYLNLLLISTDLLQSKTDKPFLPDIGDLVEEISDTGSDLYETVLFLQHHRNMLLKNAIPNDGQLSHLLEEYLTGLVYWLYHLAFLAKYRLVSIKDINLNYRLGTAKNFNHQYGELHGFYTLGQKFEYPEYSIEEEFTYNQSVLLFKGTSVQDCLDKIKDKSTYISLSPLLIDQSVFSPNDKQTPEIYYYVGSARRSYNFAEYKNEILVEGFKEKSSNKVIPVKDINRLTPKFDELYKHIEQVFSPFKTPAP